jgi:DNA polymerase III delta prime subunit
MFPMSSTPPLDANRTALRRSFHDGRLAHAHVVVGPPDGEGGALAGWLVSLVLCAEADPPCGACANCRRVQGRAHPDVHWIEPESKSRRIVIESIREMIQRMAQTSYQGGWKAGVLLHADRMNEPASNAFLKTLEEPPGRTLFLLVTADPQFLLPTIQSRCQRISAAGGESIDAAAWAPRVIELLAAPIAGDGIKALVGSEKLEILLGELKEAVSLRETEQAAEEEDEDVVQARVQSRVRMIQSEMMRFILNWRRDVLLCRLGAGEELLAFPAQAATLREQAGRLTEAQAIAQLQSLEQVVRRLERNIPLTPAFDLDLLGVVRPGSIAG